MLLSIFVYCIDPIIVCLYMCSFRFETSAPDSRGWKCLSSQCCLFVFVYLFLLFVCLQNCLSVFVYSFCLLVCLDLSICLFCLIVCIYLIICLFKNSAPASRGWILIYSLSQYYRTVEKVWRSDSVACI